MVSGTRSSGYHHKVDCDIHPADPSTVFTTFMNLLVKAVSVFLICICVYFPGIAWTMRVKTGTLFFLPV
jgi:hypothetical protein